MKRSPRRTGTTERKANEIVRIAHNLRKGDMGWEILAPVILALAVLIRNFPGVEDKRQEVMLRDMVVSMLDRYLLAPRIQE